MPSVSEIVPKTLILRCKKLFFYRVLKLSTQNIVLETPHPFILTLSTPTEKSALQKRLFLRIK